MSIHIFTTILGFLVLAYAANCFVYGATALAQQFGISSLVIGLTVVALGTSAPEIFVGITAAMEGKTGLAVGNAIGSNIANIGLVLGLTALIKPLQTHSRILTREFPMLFIIMITTWLLVFDNYLRPIDGVILLIGLFLLVAFLIWIAKTGQQDEPLANEMQAETPQNIPLYQSLFWLVLGASLLPAASHFIVQGSIEIAKFIGVSDTVIGLSIVAIGTSLPELATSIVAAFKGEHDIAIGNIMGSNMFNLLAVLPFPAFINPHALPSTIHTRDLPYMLLISLFLYLFIKSERNEHMIKRWEGGILVVSYVFYLFILFRAIN